MRLQIIRSLKAFPGPLPLAASCRSHLACRTGHQNGGPIQERLTLTNHLPPFVANETTILQWFLRYGMGDRPPCPRFTVITDRPAGLRSLDELVVLTATGSSSGSPRCATSNRSCCHSLARHPEPASFKSRAQPGVTTSPKTATAWSTVLGDSRGPPSKLYGRGDYTLAAELLTAATDAAVGRESASARSRSRGSVLQPILLHRLHRGASPTGNALGFLKST